MKIAHLTDFHLRHHLPGTSTASFRLSRQMPRLLAEAVDEIRAVKPDLVAITGDVVDHPFFGRDDPGTMAQGEKDMRLIKEILQPFSCPLAMVYGNHDHPEVFRRVFGHLPDEFEVAGHRVLSFFDEEGEHNVPQRLGVQGERFLAALAGDDSRPQIHLQHYLIEPARNDGYPFAYREAASLKRALLADQRVRLVLSGHDRRGVPFFREGHVCFGIVPTFGDPPHPYRIYTLAEEEITCVERSLRPPERQGAAETS